MRLRALAPLVLACSLVAVPPAAAKTPSKTKAKTVRCKGTQVKVTVAKKAKCVKASTFAAKTPKYDRSVSVTRTLTGAASPKLPTIRMKNGKTHSGQFSAKEQVTLQNYVTVAQSRLRAAAIDAAAGRLSEAGLSLSVRRESKAPAAARTGWAGARAAANAVQLGDPQVTVTVNEATGQAQVSGKIDGTVQLDNGATANVEMTVSGTVGGAAGPAGDLTFEIGGTVNEKGKATSRKIKLNLDMSATKDACPDATGRIRYLAPYKGSFGGTDIYKAGPITYGSIAEEYAADSRVNSGVTMKDDATLPKVEFFVSYDLKIAQKVKLLGIPLKNVRVSSQATASGSLDPRTGAIDPGMKFNVAVSASGMSAASKAQIKADLTKRSEEATREMLGELAAHMKKVEDAARAGKCTKLGPNPKSGTVELGADESYPGIASHLSAPADGDKDVTGQVTWTITPEVGKAERTDGGSNPMEMTVTGAQATPNSVSVKLKAVSHSGISEATWTAKSKPPFPRTYSGPVSFTYHAQNPINMGQYQDSAGQATATYTLRRTQSFADGKQTALYDLTTLDISSLSRTEVDNNCTATLPPYAPGVVPTSSMMTLSVDPGGRWTYDAIAYAPMGILSGTSRCDGFPPTSAVIVPLFDFSTNGPESGDMREMPAKGTISGSVATGLWTGNENATKGGAWSLSPGG